MSNDRFNSLHLAKFRKEIDCWGISRRLAIFPLEAAILFLIRQRIDNKANHQIAGDHCIALEAHNVAKQLGLQKPIQWMRFQVDMHE